MDWNIITTGKCTGNTAPDKLLVVDAFDPEIPYQTSEKISLRVKNSEESKKILLREKEEIRSGNKDGKMQKSTGKKRRKSREPFHIILLMKKLQKMWL